MSEIFPEQPPAASGTAPGRAAYEAYVKAVAEHTAQESGLPLEEVYAELNHWDQVVDFGRQVWDAAAQAAIAAWADSPARRGYYDALVKYDEIREVTAQILTYLERLLDETPFEFRPDIDIAALRQRASLEPPAASAITPAGTEHIGPPS